MITQRILDTFVYEQMNGSWSVMDPMEFDQVIPGGPWETKELAEAALVEYINQNDIKFEG